ncbi:MAG TPA: SDR family oxidoreductase [Vicinamibacteria bacterium]|nr:SDR family oxidoreductase [Vicinamibacteria bacterium]
MTRKLENKVALITGGTTGIGLATAKRFAAEGARVIVTGRNRETLEAARKELGDRAEVIESDAGDERQIAQLFEGLAKTHRRLDVLFLNAGIAKFAPLAEASVKDFDAMWTLNVRGPWLALKHALPLLAEGANVIVNTSVVNQKGLPGAAAYAATKAALRAVVRGAATELAGRKIRVNAISPGPIETPIFGKLGLSKNAADDFLKDAATRIPLGRIGAADEVAGAAVFLASADASFITGSEIAVDGGLAQV